MFAYACGWRSIFIWKFLSVPPRKQIYLNYKGKRYRYNLDLSYIDARDLIQNRGFSNLNLPQINSKIANFAQFKYKVLQKIDIPSKVVSSEFVETLKNIELNANSYERFRKIALKSTSVKKAEKLTLNLIESEIYKQFKINNPSLTGIEARKSFLAIKKNIYNSIHPLQRNNAMKIKKLLQKAKNITLNSLERFFFLAIHKLNQSDEIKASYLTRGFQAIEDNNLEELQTIKQEIENIAYAQGVEL